MASVFPPRCPVCGELKIPWESGTCPECAGKLRFVKEPVCLCCGREIADAAKEYCNGCEENRLTFVRNLAVWQYDKRMKKSIADFKYNGRKEYAEYYIQHMKQCFGAQLLRYGVTVLVPVPVSDKRRRYRGFNQAEVLSEGLAKELGILSVPLIRRVRNTVPQSGLSPAERKKNLSDALVWNEKAESQCEGLPKCVALVDDIFTTGTTMEACTQVLRSHGIVSVYGACVCIGNG